MNSGKGGYSITGAGRRDRVTFNRAPFAWPYWHPPLVQGIMNMVLCLSGTAVRVEPLFTRLLPNGLAGIGSKAGRVFEARQLTGMK